MPKGGKPPSPEKIWGRGGLALLHALGRKTQYNAQLMFRWPAGGTITTVQLGVFLSHYDYLAAREYSGLSEPLVQ